MNRRRQFLAPFVAAVLAFAASACVGLKDNDFMEVAVNEGGGGDTGPDTPLDGEASTDGGDETEGGAGPDMTDGDARFGGDGDTSIVEPPDGPDAEACVSTCPQEGMARCADPATVEMCVLAPSGCMSWRSVGACGAGSLCCHGICRNDDTTVPAECVPIVLPPGYDLYVSAKPVASDAGPASDARLGVVPHWALDDGSPDDASDGEPPDVSVSDASADGDDGAMADAGADGSARGSASEPFRTLTEALAAAKPLVQSLDRVVRIYVARGTYDAALGEVFPLVVPGGVTIEGAGRGRTVVAGTGYFNTSARGPTFYETELFLTLVLGDTVRPTRVADMTIEHGNSVPSRQHYGIYCDRGPAPADGGTVPPNTILSDLTVRDHYYYGIVTTTVVGNTGCALQLRASTITGGKVGLFGICNQDFVASGELVVGDGTPEGGNTFELQTNEDGDGIGLFSQCVRSVSASYNTFVNGNYGADIVGYVGDDFSRVTPVHVHHNTFHRLSRYGLYLYGSGVIADVRDNSFTDISTRRFTTRTSSAAGIAVSGDWTAPYPVVTARNNEFLHNDTGVYIGWSNPFLQAYLPPDFGSVNDPGKNVFHCNDANGVLDYVWGGSVLLDFFDVPLPVPFLFEGNQWDNNQPTRETAKENVFGRYADIMVTNPNTLVRADTSLPGLGNCK